MKPAQSILSTIIFCTGLAAQAAPPPSQLPSSVQAELQKAQVPADALVVLVQEVGTRTVRLNWQAAQSVKPASLAKLVTTAAALDLLGPAWSWVTPVWLAGSASNGVLEGNLVIKGSGDPKLVIERMWLMLRRVQQLGVKEIRGDIVLDHSAFSKANMHPGDFDGEPNRPYNATPNALLLNYKSVVLTLTPDPIKGVAVVSSEPPLMGVGISPQVPLLPGACADWRGALKGDFSDPAHIRLGGGYPSSCGEKQWAVAYADPASYNERALAGLWREMGGKLKGRVRDGAAPTSPPTFEVRSPPLAEVVRDINKFSNNVMAQQLFLTLGLTQRNSATPEAAREVVQQWLNERHSQAAQGAVIENGSGLSRESRLSAQLLSQLLLSSWASGTMPELMSSLPVSGTDGTLRRSRGAPAGQAHLKTGSLRDVTGIAGYVLGNSARRYVVVAIVNHSRAASARPVLDAVVQWVQADQ